MRSSASAIFIACLRRGSVARKSSWRARAKARVARLRARRSRRSGVAKAARTRGIAGAPSCQARLDRTGGSDRSRTPVTNRPVLPLNLASPMTSGNNLSTVTTAAPSPIPGVSRHLRFLTPGVVALALLSAAYAAWRQDWTYDERIHVSWAERLLDTGVTERWSQNRYNSRTPILLPNVVAKKLAQALGTTDPHLLRFATRLPTLLWLLGLLVAVFGFARAFFGETVAHLATLAAALDPNLIAHGSLATSDVSFALGCLLTLGAAAAFAAHPSLPRGAALGLALGFAVTAKFMALLLAPTLVLLPLALKVHPPQPWRAAGRIAAGLTAGLIAAGFLICASHLFREMAQPLSSIQWRSAAITRLAQAFPALALPLPSGFLTGLDFGLAFESPAPGHHEPEWNVVILGRRYPQGVWFYFGLLWILKTPVLVLVALLVGLLQALRTRLLISHPAARFFAVNLALWLAYLSFFFSAQIGYRFALMCVPVVCILAAAGLASLRWPVARRAGLGVVFAALLENGLYVGNPLSFTNAAVWPKRQVFRLMADSNVDWGQNGDKIERWLTQRRLSYTHLDPVHVLPGHNTFNLNVLAGVFNFEQHRWLRARADPRGHFGHTYVWFWIDHDLFDRFLTEERRLEPGPAAEGQCGGAASTVLPPGSRPEISLSGQPVPGAAWIVCVETRKEAQFGLRAVEGHCRFGPYRPGTAQKWETLEQGQVAWYLLEPGTHVLALSQIPNRRAWLPNVFEGKWLVREHGVALALRRGRFEADGALHVVSQD